MRRRGGSKRMLEDRKLRMGARPWYLGENDFRYGILVLASVVVGYKVHSFRNTTNYTTALTNPKMLFPSPRYGAPAIAKVIDQVSGTIMLTSRTPLPVTQEILQARSMRTYQIPSLEDLFSAETQPYPFTKTFAQHKLEPLVSLHTSGTSGFPKPILWTHDWADSFIQSLSLPSPSDELQTATHFNGSHKRVMFLTLPRKRRNSAIIPRPC